MKWLLPDAGQVVLPTTHGNEDTYPLGVAVTSAATKSIEQGRVHVIISRSVGCAVKSTQNRPPQLACELTHLTSHDC